MNSVDPAAIDFSKPMIDTVQVPGTGKQAGKTLSFHVSAELMKNQQEASPIDPTENIVVVQDSTGKPLIFTIDTRAKLRLLKYDPRSGSGWRVINLIADFSTYSGAKAFDVAQDDKGRISIAFALTKTGSQHTDIFTATLLSDDETQTDWTKFSTLAHKVEKIDDTFIADKIKVGISDNDQQPVIVISGAIGSQEFYYQIDAAGDPAQKLEFPENVGANLKALMGISLGYAFGQKGVFFLYRQGESQTLECTTIAGGGQGVLHYDFSPGQGAIPANLRYNCMATPTGSQTDPLTISSDIFVGTDKGIFIINNARPADFQKVTDQLTNVHEIMVRQDRDTISIWALSNPSTIHYIRGKKGATVEWDAPILFSTDTIHIAPIRNKAMQANELFLVDQERNVVHHWQDPGSTLWQQRTIKIKDSDFLIDFNSYTTQITLEDQDGNGLFNEVLKVTASEWTYVSANGLIYILDKSNPAEIPTDPTGRLTLVVMAQNISTPILHIEGDSFDKTLNIYPNGKVQKGLQSIKTGDDLKTAKTQDGKPVFGKTYDQGTWNGVADNIQQLNTASSKLQTGTRSGNTVFVSVENKSVKHDGVLDASQLPDDFIIGMRRENGTWQPHPQLMQEKLSLGGIGHDIEGLAGDLWHDIENAFEDGIKEAEKGIVKLEDGAVFIVHKIKQGAEDVLAFTLKVADKVINVVLTTLSSVLRVISWILKQIGAALLKILEWLGFLFIWIEIWKAHKVVAAIMQSALDYAVEWTDKGLDVAQQHVDQFFATAESDIKGLTLPEEYKKRSPRGAANTNHAAHPLANLKSPQANFVNHHLLHGGLANGTGAALAGGNDPLTQFLNDMVAPTVTQLAQSLEKDLQDLMALISDQGKTYEDLLQLVGDLANTVLKPLKTLLDGLFKFITQLLGDIQHGLEDSLDVPFLGTLYTFVTKLLGQKESLTPINAVALIIAIPTVVVGKITTGKVPLVDEGHDLDEAHLFQQLLGSPAAAAMPFPRAAGADGEMLATAVHLPAVSSSFDDTAYNKFASNYSLWAGIAGTFAGYGVVITNILMAANAGSDEESTPLLNGKKFKLDLATSIYVGLLLCKFGLTVPLPRKDQKMLAYVPKAIGFSLAAIHGLTIIPVAGFIPKPLSVQINGATLAGFDSLVLIAALIGDITDLVEKSGSLPGLALTADSLANLSGIVQGLGQAFGGTTPESIEEFGIPSVAYILGAGGRFVGGGINFIQIAEADDKDITQYVNAAG
ncbi:MAG: hypothetical protein KDJ99_03020 [Candidatus Competibacteraceae bacterium]|nr:hypothetical protein [Candidatus Competibacteraceae bacterium]